MKPYSPHSQKIQQAEQVVDSPVHDPSIAATLVALDFPLIRPRFAVRSRDLGSQHVQTREDHDSWIFGSTSPTHGRLDDVLRLYHAELPRTDKKLSTPELCKLCMTNRRVLKLAATQRLPVHQLAQPSFSRLSSWPILTSAPIAEDLSPNLVRDNSTDYAAIATALGHSLLSFARYGDDLYYVLENNPLALYSLPQIKALYRDRDFIRANSDPLAVLSAACMSFKPLYQAAAVGGETFVLHKNGRYATLDKSASDAERRLAAQHLTT